MRVSLCVCGRIEQIFSQNCFGLNCLEMFLGAYEAIKKETFVEASRGGRGGRWTWAAAAWWQGGGIINREQQRKKTLPKYIIHAMRQLYKLLSNFMLKLTFNNTPGRLVRDWVAFATWRDHSGCCILTWSSSLSNLQTKVLTWYLRGGAQARAARAAGREPFPKGKPYTNHTAATTTKATGVTKYAKLYAPHLNRTPLYHLIAPLPGQRLGSSRVEFHFAFRCARLKHKYRKLLSR